MMAVCLQVVKVDCDTHKDLMTHYRARGLPLMAIFNGGEVCAISSCLRLLYSVALNQKKISVGKRYISLEERDESC